MSNAAGQIRSYLLLRKPLRALVGGRIFAGIAPSSGAFPKISSEADTQDQPHHFGGAPGSVEASIEINVYGYDPEMVDRIATAISQAMNGLQANMSVLSVDHVRLEGQSDKTLPPADGGEDPIYNVEQDWTVWHRATAPSFPPSYGASLMAASGSNYIPSLEEGVKDWTNTMEVVEPNPEFVPIYEELHHLYKTLYPSLEDRFEKASLIHENLL